jgi:hypothetical protein
VGEAQVAGALAAFRSAPDLMPENPEGVFWFASALVNAGQVEAARCPIFQQVYRCAARLAGVGAAHGRGGAAAGEMRRCWRRITAG